MKFSAWGAHAAKPRAGLGRWARAGGLHRTGSLGRSGGPTGQVGWAHGLGRAGRMVGKASCPQPPMPTHLLLQSPVMVR